MDSRGIINKKAGFIFNIVKKELSRSFSGLPMYLRHTDYLVNSDKVYGSFVFELYKDLSTDELNRFYKALREYKVLYEYIDISQKTEPISMNINGRITYWPGKVKGELRVYISDEYTDEIEDLMTVLRIKGYNNEYTYFTI